MKCISGALVAHKAAVRGLPVPAGEEKLSARSQVEGAHDVPRVRRQGLAPRCSRPARLLL